MQQFIYTIHAQNYWFDADEDEHLPDLQITVDAVYHDDLYDPHPGEAERSSARCTGYYITVGRRELDKELGVKLYNFSQSPLAHTKGAAVSQLGTVCANLGVEPQPLPWQ